MAKFAIDPERDPWDRQPGESAEQFEWFQTYLSDGERRTYARVAERAAVKADRVRNTALRHEWHRRVEAWRAHNSRVVQSRFEEQLESILVPWTQAAARMIRLALTGNDDVPADRALNAATNVLRLAREPSVSDLVRIAEAGSPASGGAESATPVTATIMRALEDHPEARQHVIEAVRQAADQENQS